MKRITKASVVGAMVLLVPLISVAAGGFFFVDDSTGNVGIGNTSPQYKLDVSGAIYSRLVTVSGSSIDWSQGNVQTLTLTSNPTLTFSNGQAGGEYKLIINQDSVGSRTITWPTSIKWSNGMAPSLTSAASSTDLVNFVYDGTNYLGSYVLNYEKLNPIAFDTATDCGSGSSCSVTTSGSNRALVAFVHGDVGTDNTPTCTYNGASMTLADKVQTPSDRWIYGFVLVGPASGSYTISCSGPSFIRILSASYTGVQQSGQPDNHATNTGSSVSSLSTNYSVTNGESWIIQHDYAGGGAASSATVDSLSSTQRGSQVDGGKIFDSSAGESAGTHTVAWTNSSSSNLSQLIISLIPTP